MEFIEKYIINPETIFDKTIEQDIQKATILMDLQSQLKCSIYGLVKLERLSLQELNKLNSTSKVIKTL